MRSVLRLLHAAILASSISPAMSVRSDAAPSALPAGAALADLPMLVVTGSPRIHFDLAAIGDPPLLVVLDTGFGTAVGGGAAIRAFGGERVPGDQPSYRRNTLLGKPLTVRPTNETNEQAQNYPFVRLGGAFLRDFVLELDFEAGRVRFLDPQKVELPKTAKNPNEAVFDLAVFNSRPFVEIDINERPVRLALDTSAPVPVWLSKKGLLQSAVSTKTLPLLRRPTERHSALRVFETDTVRLGSVDLGVFPVIVSRDPLLDAFGGNGHAIGIDLLSQFRVRLDIARRRLWLERQSFDPMTFAGLPYSATRRSGAYVTSFGSWFEVFGVQPNSPAERLGLQPGDRIDPEQLGMTSLSEILGAVEQQAPLMVHRPAAASGGYDLVLLPLTNVPGPTTTAK